jgi:2-keto-4-pentenoate hydratase/2-oxohepta-3-ene-1,7-dioic acid hydratase in catechol pathway
MRESVLRQAVTTTTAKLKAECMRFAVVKLEQATVLAVKSEGRYFTDRKPVSEDVLDKLIAEGVESIKETALRLKGGDEVGETIVEFLSPLARPSKIICVGLNYRDHSAESGFAQPDYPTLFLRTQQSIIAHKASIVRPIVSAALDYEGELAAVIGKRGRHISKADALEHVIGYSVFNDASVRDFQHRTPQWTMGKNFEGTGAFGPGLVTADELPRGARGLSIKTILNGTVVQDGNTEDLVFDVETLVSTISEVMELQPGDMIITGTPSGVGAARKPPLWMKAGDTCEVQIEGVGTLSNQIADERKV